MRVRALAMASVCVCLTYVAYPLAQGSPSNMRVQRVVLYKAGVGYFEHLARVVGSGSLTLQFTNAQLNDVLSSLTAIDLDNGRVSGITYDSTAPIEQRIATLGIQLPPTASRAQFYDALRGTRVEVTQGATQIVGRLLGVERRPAAGNTTVDDLTVVADDGRVRTFEMTPGVSVRIVDPALRDDVAQYLSLVGSSRTEELRTVTIAAAGTGARRLLVSYVSEVPVWKSTYRLVFSPDAPSPLLQGWAVVDNTMGEDWTNVDLSLVAGAPQSFIQNISQPYYASRPVVPLPRAALLQPQVHEPTLSVNEAATVTGAAPVAPAPPGRGVGLGGGLGGGVYAPPPPQPAQALTPTAAGQPLADLFEYHLEQPITIRRNQSALVPILSAPVEAERIALWRPSLPENRPLRALWLTNTTPLTLDGGSFSVMDGGAFAGEGLIEPLKPAERRLVSYGTDLGVVVSARNDPAPSRILRLVAHDGVIVATEADRSVWTYSLRNAGSEPRALVIEHPIKAGWTVDRNPAQIETTANLIRFAVALEPHRDTTFVVRETRPIEMRVAIGDLDERRLVEIVQRGAPEASLRLAIQPIVAKRAEVADANARLSSITNRLERSGEDEQRVRDNMKALGASKEDRTAHQRYADALKKDDEAIAAAQAEAAGVAAERDARQAELSKLIASVSFDMTAGGQ